MYERKQCRKWLTVDIDRTKFKKQTSLRIEEVGMNNYLFIDVGMYFNFFFAECTNCEGL